MLASTLRCAALTAVDHACPAPHVADNAVAPLCGFLSGATTFQLCATASLLTALTGIVMLVSNTSSVLWKLFLQCIGISIAGCLCDSLLLL